MGAFPFTGKDYTLRILKESLPTYDGMVIGASIMGYRE